MSKYPPNGRYYCNAPISHSFWRKPNQRLAEFGAKLRLSCGSNWLIVHEDGRAVKIYEIQYAASGYDHMSSIDEYDQTTCTEDKWHELVRAVLMYEYTIHSLKPLPEVAEMLGLEETP